MDRKRIPTETETNVLLKGARRCPLCFYLHGDLTEKHGQIAHLNNNSANFEEDNLVFLCMVHHSVYDSTTSQHKNYTIHEVKAMRTALYSAIANREHVNAVGDPKKTIQPVPFTAVEKARRYEAEQQFFYDRSAFRSQSNIAAIMSEVGNVLDGIEKLCVEIGENAFGGFRRERTDRGFILTTNSAGLIVRWQQPYPPQMDKCGLCVEEYEGRIFLQRELATVVPMRRPTLQKGVLFEPDLSPTRQPGWKDPESGIFIASQSLADKCFHQFIDMIDDQSKR